MAIRSSHLGSVLEHFRACLESGRRSGDLYHLTKVVVEGELVTEINYLGSGISSKSGSKNSVPINIYLWLQIQHPLRISQSQANLRPGLGLQGLLLHNLLARSLR